MDTVHDLRHIYASLLIARASAVMMIHRRRDHQFAVKTRRYMWPDGDCQVTDAVDHVLAGTAGAR